MRSPVDVVICEHGDPLRSRALYKTYPLESRDQRKCTPSDLVITREIGFTPETETENLPCIITVTSKILVLPTVKGIGC